MNWTKFFKVLAAAGPAVGPIFIHSARGVMIFNATEEIVQAAVDAHTDPVVTAENKS